MNGHKPSERLSVLVTRLLDGSLSEVENDKLRELLRGNPKAQRFYLRQVTLHAMLQWENASPAVPVDEHFEELDQDDDFAILGLGRSTARGELAVVSPIPSLADSRFWDQVIADAQRDKKAVSADKAPAEPASAPPEGLRRLLPGVARRGAAWVSASRRRKWSAAAIGLVASLAIVFVATLDWNDPEESQPFQAPGAQLAANAADGSAAQLARAIGCRWSDDHPSPRIGQGLKPLERLDLEAGVAEIAFTSGAKVVIRGPVQFQVLSGGVGRLEKGTLAASIPKKAVGFAIQTPMTVIVDRGTEFGVHVAEDGTGDVQVFTGYIEIAPAPSTSASISPSIDPQSPASAPLQLPRDTQPMVLRAGQAARVDPAGIQPASRLPSKMEDFKTMSRRLDPPKFFFPPDDPNDNGLALVGDAFIAAGKRPGPKQRLRLTIAAPGRTGSVWCTSKQRLAGGFMAEFQYQAPAGPSQQNRESSGGFALLIQDTPAQAELLAGDRGAPERSVALRFCGTSVELLAGGKTIASSVQRKQPHRDPSTDPRIHFAKIEYMPGQLKVIVDEHVALDNVRIDLENISRSRAVDAAGLGWIGFGAATDQTPEPYDILLWRFKDLSGD